MPRKAKNTERVGKIERVLNLVAFLLKQDEPVSWSVICSRVAGYGGEVDDRRSVPLPDGTARVAEQVATYGARTAFVASQRRFARDKDLLKSLGIPVEYVPHNSVDTGGYYIRRDSFFLPPAEATEEEQRVLACLHTTAALEGKNPVLGPLLSALQKLRFDDALGADHGAEENLPVAKLGAAEQAAVQGNLAALINAAQTRKTADFFYHSMHRDAVEERTVEPYGVFLREGRWYLIAFCKKRGETRMFRLDRIMTQVQVNRDNPGRPDFRRPRNFSLKKYLGARPWESGGGPEKLYDAEIEFDVKAWWMAREALSDASCRVRQKGEGAVVVLPVCREEPLVRWLLKWGPHAVVASPRRLRDLMVKTVNGIKERHMSH